MDEIIEKPSSFLDEPEEASSQPEIASELPSEEPEVVSSDKVTKSESLVATIDNKDKVESCVVALPESKNKKQAGGSLMSYLLSHPILLLLTVVCLIAVVYLILDFLRGFFPWMQK